MKLHNGSPVTIDNKVQPTSDATPAPKPITDRLSAMKFTDLFIRRPGAGDPSSAC